MRRARAWQGVLALLCLVVTTSVVDAAPRTDVIVLRNGDRLTCEIKILSHGRIEVETDDAGTIDIEWDKVARVISTRVFEIETSSGQSVVGVITSPADFRLAVTDTAGATFSYEAKEVIRISPIGASFFNRMDGALDLGFSYTESSGVAQLTLNANATFRKPKFELSATGSSYVTHQRDADDTDRQSFQVGYVRRLPRRWFVGGFAAEERNPDLGFEHRETLAGVVGQRLVRSNRGLLSWGGGLAVSREQPLDGAGETNVDALASFSGSYYSYDSPKTMLSFSIQAFPGLSETGRVRTEVNASLSREIIRNFTVGVSGYHSYDNRPPTEGVSSNDFGSTVSIGWKF